MDECVCTDVINWEVSNPMRSTGGQNFPADPKQVVWIDQHGSDQQKDSN